MKIFRKKRSEIVQDSTKESSSFNTDKYLKYAIGEIFLVVVGILIALQINNWNQSSKDKKALQEYLAKIKVHTNEDLIMLDSLTVLREGTQNVCKMTRKSILNKTEDQNNMLLMGAGFAFFDFRFASNSGGYNALINSDYFGKINNTKLDSLLSRYHRIVDEIAQNEESYNSYINSQENYISTTFDRSLVLALSFMDKDSLSMMATPMSEYYKEVAAYTSLPAYRNVIGLAAFQFDLILAQYDQLNEVGQNVIAEINDNYLNQN